MLTMRAGRVTACYADARKALQARTRVQHAIGSNEGYGLIESARLAEAANRIPQGVLNVEGSDERLVLKRNVFSDQPLTSTCPPAG